VTAVTAVTAASVAAEEPGLAGRLREEIRSGYEFMPATLVGNVAGIAIVLVLFWRAAPGLVIAGWLAAYAVMLSARLLLLRRFNRAEPASAAEWQRWRWWWNVGTLTSGVMWGCTAWLFYHRGDSAQQIGLIVTVYTFCAVAVPILATQPRVFALFCLFCYVPMAARIGIGNGAQGYQLAGILFVIFATTSVLARAYRQALQRAIDLKLQGDELAAQLRVEKQAADEARHQAEVANRAKTQFFAAASHDLRQPLHAMGLFAEALRAKSRDDEVAHLVNSINGSVDALESLFSELLDITRIDSGGIEVNTQAFAVGDILRKLRLGFEPNAFEKGLALRFRGGQHVALADPLLVERIVRNLVSNAIRYTNDGTVLVSCRKRANHLLLQVWDTGLGIREEEQRRIFEEFYQVPNTARISAEQRRGLGLGLAIVKRLADLMNAPLTLRSRPDHGSVFTLELPLGKAIPVNPPGPGGKAPLGITLHGRTIVVVEDEPAVLAGLEVLLKAWGATLLAFDSVAAVTAWADGSGTAPEPPDLLIVDYRLEVGRTGIDAIRALRQRFGARIPAIIVTGSTMTGHESEAQEHDFHVLIKPVVPNKLRAMIAFKLGVKAA